ncbi:hypothetical protein KZC51_16590 [Microbacterium sp. SSW1-49]|uniref:DUF4082 domain-containing protein n=1 Tax=Microbacterium croceum TaxID=2851645 RepID=A0ABT0FI65_9MICO|nr:hypothetical protein [Microbacterium croceum]MCK2037748.1 hypothetical protein [Microbacterium croceum]
MTEESVVPASRASLSRRTVLSAGAWSIPVVAAAVAVPLHAASVATGAINADGVVLTFPDANLGGSSELSLSGQITFSSATTAPTNVTVTFTWAGAGDNAGTDGIWVYAPDSTIDGWTFVQGAPNDGLYPAVILQTTVATGTTQVPVVSRRLGSTSNAIMYGEETPIGGFAAYDGAYTIRFSAPGYTDAEIVVPYTQVFPD